MSRLDAFVSAYATDDDDEAGVGGVWVDDGKTRVANSRRCLVKWVGREHRHKNIINQREK